MTGAVPIFPVERRGVPSHRHLPHIQHTTSNLYVQLERTVGLVFFTCSRERDARSGPGMTHLRTGNDPCWGGSHWPDGAGQVVLCRR